MAARGMHPSTLAALGNHPGDLSAACREVTRHWLSLNHLKHAVCVAVYATMVHAVLMLFGVYAKRNHIDDDGGVEEDSGLGGGGAHGAASPRFPGKLNPVAEYGLVMTVVLYGLRLTAFTPLIFVAINGLGLALFSVFPPKPRLRRSPFLGPFFCFRVVTRGTFPNLVRENVEKNFQLCKHMNLQNFEIEVVTDNPVNLTPTAWVHEVVVPKEYQTAHGTLFKARALQYSLEAEVSTLSSEDWVIHLDEETLLSEDCVVGILNFVAEGRHQFGQGVITYSKGTIVNWLTTLADSIRVGIDYGALRFCLTVLHKPVFGWKGSFIVANAAAERLVSFDHGPEASIAEDCFFAMVAIQRGYSFGFVQGEMHEKSAFTFKDFVQQRRRWMEGISLTAHSDKIPLRYKVGPLLVTLSAFCMPFAVLNIPLGFLTPIPMPWYLDMICAFITATFAYLYLIGSLKSFSPKRFGYVGCMTIAVLSVLNSFLVLGFELAASLLAFWGTSKNEFYIVEKEITQSSTPPSSSAPASVLSLSALSTPERHDFAVRRHANGYISRDAADCTEGDAIKLASTNDGNANGYSKVCNGHVV